jgi:hypothetical protein
MRAYAKMNAAIEWIDKAGTMAMNDHFDCRGTEELARADRCTARVLQ